ncbi:flagellar basal body rod protein FlgB [Striga asiatica]|uniref:Flagellar basal body rod protein FlgB n=1 Tax=Striga asiatica TaxID=4170 RepID=A0A5A7QGG8_STRAF|nr:flagellar basal body rod protein FlgB [Striga asiatica]
MWAILRKNECLTNFSPSSATRSGSTTSGIEHVRATGHLVENREKPEPHLKAYKAKQNEKEVDFSSVACRKGDVAQNGRYSITMENSRVTQLEQLFRVSKWRLYNLHMQNYRKPHTMREKNNTHHMNEMPRPLHTGAAPIHSKPSVSPQYKHASNHPKQTRD